MFKKDFTTKFFFIFSFLFSLGFLATAILGYWTHSEIYAAHSAQYFFSTERIDYLLSLKPLFYFILFVGDFIASIFSLYPMTVARVLFAINGLCLLALTTLFIKNKTDKTNAILAALVLMTSFLFLERGYRVRSDLLVSSLCLASLFLANTLVDKNSKKIIGIILVFLSMALVTPKSIYWFLFGSAFLVHELKNKQISWRILLKLILVFSMGSLGISFFLKDPFFLTAIKESSEFYSRESLSSIWFAKKSIFTRLEVLSYKNLILKKEPIIVFLAALKSLFIGYRIFISRDRKWDFLDTGFCLLVLVVLIHPKPKPFFITSLMPFFVMSFFTDEVWLKIKSLYSQFFMSVMLVGFLSYAIVLSSHSFYTSFKGYNNYSQKIHIEELYKFVDKNPSIKIYDPGFILYRTKNYHWYAPQGYHSGKIFKGYFNKYNLDIIFNTYGLNQNNLLDWEDNGIKYIHGGHSIYYRSLVIDITQKQKILGKEALEQLNQRFKTHVPKSYHKYWFLFLDKNKKPINDQLIAKYCLSPPSSSLQQLKAACIYSEQEFLKGFIFVKNTAQFVAVFYIEPIQNLDPNLRLKNLYRYDVLFR